MSAPLRLLAIPGDGIGQEVVPAALAVLRATGLPLEVASAEAGWGCFERHGASLPDETLAAARAADAVLFGAVASPSHPVAGYRSPIVALRRALDLYANIRPTASDAQPGRRAAVDLVVVRENTEGLYAGRERTEDGGDTAIAERVITRRASERIARVALELARGRGAARAPRVTIVHKANILRETCGLFRTSALRVAESYPDVAVDELLVDTAALQLVQRPERFDVIVTTNLFGDILSDIASFWGGGMGMAASANIGDAHALFEPVHGAAPDIAGRGVANPLAAIGCVALLLDHLGRRAAPAAPADVPTDAGGGDQLGAGAYLAWAGRVRAAVRQVLAGPLLTPDLGGSAGTEDVTGAVIAALGAA